ncbi:BrnT family toxin [uncultured Brevundimonas sp.]|uniref:BrnT family toxin n=1 Tax=uncultured Brevundimonas sp. TaxID=213418 RepID=UPI00262469B2|nr:BrnT family toxin [uncultured Brevundimonas sp.]
MIVFDPEKDRANIAKHGVSLRLAEEMDLDTAVIVIDTRHDYKELRRNAYGLINGVLHALTYTMRGSDIRAISLRRARETEVLKWIRR